MLNYTAVCTAHNGRTTAYIPSLGLFADGDDRAEALENLHQILDWYLIDLLAAGEPPIEAPQEAVLAD